MFRKTFSAGVLAASLALTSLTPTSASARMSDEDALAGILTLLFLGAVIHNSRDNDRAAPAPVPHPAPQVNDRWRVLPANCLRRIETRRGETVRLFTQRCLQNNYSHVNRLPQECHVRVRTAEGQRRQGFRARCLRNAGFRTNQR